MITSDRQAVIVSTLVQRIDGLKAVYIFGSRAEKDDKNVRKDSDYDIAFLASHKPTFSSYEKFLLQGQLAEKLKTEWVDLVDIGAIKDHTLRLNVIKGKRIFCQDEDAVIEWEAKSITMAQDWFWKSKPFRDAEMSDIRKRVEDYYKEKAG